MGPLVTKPRVLYVGRLPVDERSEQNILFAINELKRIQPYADYGILTMIGHSNGGDVSMFFAQEHPELVRMIVTADNLRVPCLMSGRAKILLFRSNDWKPDPGVVPSEIQSRNAGITIVQTNTPHVEMSDRGADRFKDSIGSAPDQFLNDNSNGPAVLEQVHHDGPVCNRNITAMLSRFRT
jgi:pimeloyl-ACP methyl ester carboxylesterase